MSIGVHQFSGDNAVVWLIPRPAGIPESIITKFQDRARIGYEAKVYLKGNVSAEKAKGVQTPDLSQIVVEEGQGMVVRFSVSGEVFVTADNRKVTDPRGLELYGKAFEALRAVGIEPTSAEAEPREPELQVEEITLNELAEPAEKEPSFRYPINLSPAGEAAPKMELDDEAKIWTVIGRFYIWQKEDEKGGLLELQADNAVIFLLKEQPQAREDQRGADDIPAEAIYLSGDAVMTSGQRTIRADEIYYDFQRKKAIALNVVMRNFDATEGIPIYVRAAKLRQLAEDKFAADNMTLTTSEFYLPQISFNASSVIITDTTTIDEQQGGVSKSSYDAQMHDVRLKMYDKTIFYWPFVRSNLQRPDTPLKTARVGYDSTWGTMVETRWYLARLLGLQEPEGTDSTLALDYYSDRGFGGGIQTNYKGENYFGRILGYMIHDTGEDRLGSHFTRKNIEPPRELRGRFRWQHRHFLPYNWQLTSELSYISDENFMEGFYRSEFYVGKEQETLIHLKRIEDNWGLSFLSKVRINDFVNELEELPTAEFHWTGQSFLDDKLTFYSDSQVSRFRQRYASSNNTAGSEQFFSFATTRNEVDMPITIGKATVVPFVAGTVAYEDGFGFYREIDGGMAQREDSVWFGETGLRASTQPYWKVFPDVKSELWDLNQLRHLIRPYLTAVAYTQNESVFEQRDTLNVGISQRLQTKRGSGEVQRQIDWMRLNMDVTWVNNSGDASAGPDKFIWNKPFIPPINTYSTLVPQQDRRSSHIFGPRRNYFGADYTWRLSDTTAVLSDMNFDMQSGVVQQFNVGFSHLRWPNLEFYLGSRYLRRLDNGYREQGSNAVTVAATYVLDPRYTVVFSQQLDFDYGATVRSDITLIRR
ncbi:MAG: LPS assembly protein LptD [Planctomycetota bacterium]